MLKKDTRPTCCFCGMKTWRKDVVGFMQDHDRPQGGVCRRAQKMYPKEPTWVPCWKTDKEMAGHE